MQERVCTLYTSFLSSWRTRELIDKFNTIIEANPLICKFSCNQVVARRGSLKLCCKYNLSNEINQYSTVP